MGHIKPLAGTLIVGDLKAASADRQVAHHGMGGVFKDTTTAISLQSKISLCMFQVWRPLLEFKVS
jgi:hypothetical protein